MYFIPYYCLLKYVIMSDISVDQLAKQIAASLLNAKNEGTVCEFSVGSTPQDATDKKKCYKIIDGIYVQVPCWAEGAQQQGLT
jgi:hypothetical protein